MNPKERVFIVYWS